MLECKDLTEMGKTWLSELDKAIEQELGKEMCEACRMVISILSLLWAYFPGSDVEGLTEQAESKFKEAVVHLGIMLERKLVGAPDNTYEVVETSLKGPNGPVSDAPERSVVYRLTVENWLSLLIPRLAREATYLVTVGEVFPLIQVSP